MFTSILMCIVVCVSPFHHLEAQSGISVINISNVSCIIYDLHLINCTWKTNKDVPENSNFTLLLRQKTEEICHVKVLERQKDNFRCHFMNVEIEYDDINLVDLTITGYSKEFTINQSNTYFNPFRLEKLNPPINVSVSKTAEDVTLSWEQPVTTYSFEPICFIYEIKDSIGRNIKVPASNVKKYVFHHHKGTPAKNNRFFQVRVNGNAICREPGYWSDWSQRVYLDNEIEIRTDFMVPVIISSTIFTLLFAILLYTSYETQIKKKLFPPIPHPKIKFKDVKVPSVLGTLINTVEPEEILVVFAEGASSSWI
ncbi:interleukin-5 receptor subunit alpha isoform X2 [Amia ocellicauda]|uniref:interleukin-5 receptor subunit alpha isoform X2 n=1 Tax=Amia ocellicauda TaxID=2972642 RepID=UPI003464D85D